MSVFIAPDGSWGGADGLVVIDDSSWIDADYDLMATWNNRWIAEYAAYCETAVPYLSPTEWQATQPGVTA